MKRFAIAAVVAVSSLTVIENYTHAVTVSTATQNVQVLLSGALRTPEIVMNEMFRPEIPSCVGADCVENDGE